jgi:hypothetical protein
VHLPWALFLGADVGLCFFPAPSHSLASSLLSSSAIFPGNTSPTLCAFCLVMLHLASSVFRCGKSMGHMFLDYREAKLRIFSPPVVNSYVMELLL